MKTIVFHSYKGGVGRTLALLRFARALSKFGHRVVALDLDVDAPGLHHKIEAVFAAKAEKERARQQKESLQNKYLQSTIRGGYVDYLAYFQDRIGLDKQFPSLIANQPEAAGDSVRKELLKQYIVKVTTSDPGAEKCRSFKLLPAGTGDQKYWWNLTSEWFSKLFSVSRNEYTSRGKFRLHNNRAFFKQELEIIKGLYEDETDFFLVDCKSAREYSSVPLYYWADVVVSMFPANREGLQGAVQMHNAIRDVTRSIPDRGDVKIIPVICRVTDEFKDEANYEIMREQYYLETKDPEPTETKKTRAKKFDFKRLRNFSRATSDELFVSNAEGIVWDPAERPWHPDVVSDQIELYMEIMNQIGRDDYMKMMKKLARNDKHLRSEWEDELTVRGSGPLSDSNALKDLSESTIINIDGQRNVLLRAVSLRTLISTLADYVSVKARRMSGPNLNIANNEIRKIFHTAGLKIGSNFGTQSTEQDKAKGRNLTFDQRVAEWCAYDSKSGAFGRMQPQIDGGSATVSGRIIWSHCFLAEKKDGDLKVAASAFLTGYLRGMLQVLGRGTEIERPKGARLRFSVIKKKVTADKELEFKFVQRRSKR